MDMHGFSEWLYGTGVSSAIRDNFWVVPVVQSINITAIAVVIGSALVTELRIAGVIAPEENICVVAQRYLPWMWRALLPDSDRISVDGHRVLNELRRRSRRRILGQCQPRWRVQRNAYYACGDALSLANHQGPYRKSVWPARERCRLESNCSRLFERKHYQRIASPRRGCYPCGGPSTPTP